MYRKVASGVQIKVLVQPIKPDRVNEKQPRRIPQRLRKNEMLISLNSLKIITFILNTAWVIRMIKI
ncbi:hypothetical protein GMES_1213 [Paraglaciecola mesophila KMM 241]|uniref:Uncharacterized protein n=1 Tax=Paraglaciecola mesophila KMM 241 TaxID=1128912 RepID=K6YZC3_9ALTE|nr:hypothetical protein GMES_1213 [Paraglaciecola mesophila KMM 241]